jgi:hypothetical protein
VRRDPVGLSPRSDTTKKLLARSRTAECAFRASVNETVCRLYFRPAASAFGLLCSRRMQRSAVLLLSHALTTCASIKLWQFASYGARPPVPSHVQMAIDPSLYQASHFMTVRWRNAQNKRQKRHCVQKLRQRFSSSSVRRHSGRSEGFSTASQNELRRLQDEHETEMNLLRSQMKMVAHEAATTSYRKRSRSCWNST